jgi:hypothetical protein
MRLFLVSVSLLISSCPCPVSCTCYATRTFFLRPARRFTSKNRQSASLLSLLPLALSTAPLASLLRMLSATRTATTRLPQLSPRAHRASASLPHIVSSARSNSTTATAGGAATVGEIETVGVIGAGASSCPSLELRRTRMREPALFLAALLVFTFS